METIDVKTENLRRNSLIRTPYNPVSGAGCCGERVFVAANAFNDGDAMVPVLMQADSRWDSVNTRNDWVSLRCLHDFEYWAFMCARIKDKTSGAIIPFTLNRPQRRLLAVMEKMRTSHQPIRIIMLKARQWGGSTLVQLYMAWIQTVVTQNCNSLICAHVKDISSTIRGIYTRLLENYPLQHWEGDEPPAFKPFEGSRNVRRIAGRNCCVTIGTSENPEAVRGADYALAHLSEVAFWADTPSSTPEDFIRAVCGSINYAPGTLVVLESTANGVGNFFHREWIRSEKGESDKIPVFVPWYEIDIYTAPLPMPAEKFYSSFSPYEHYLWNSGCTLEQIAWYRNKQREYPDSTLMRAEYPSNPSEAFAGSGESVFAHEKIEQLRRMCVEPAFRGELLAKADSGRDALSSIRFVEDSNGNLSVWKMPENDIMRDRYIVAVDIGGRTSGSDWSVIAVFDRAPVLDGGKIEVVAQWRGHNDHDLIAWTAARIARFYNNALLVLESNTFESDNIGGDPALSVLSEISDIYSNLYYRTTESARDLRVGFHTNRATKTLVISNLISMVRENAYVERDNLACNELAVYRHVGSTYAAADGNHDDILMTRAIGLYVATRLRAPERSFSDTLVRWQLLNWR